MKFGDAVTVSPYHIAYSDELKIRVGPFRHEDPSWRPDARDGEPDDGTLHAIRKYEHIDWLWEHRFTAAWARADWTPGLPKVDAVLQLARIAGVERDRGPRDEEEAPTRTAPPSPDG